MKPIYLDYNATTPVHPDVAQAMQPFLAQFFGNPSSSHIFGREVRSAIKKARGQVAALLNCEPSEIVFTSGGSESNNTAIKGAAFANVEKRKHVITSSVEHPATIQVCKFLEKLGWKVTYLPVDRFGVVAPEDVTRAITPETVIVSVMHANNEVGSIQPIRDISHICRKNGVLLHTDAAQSAGKITCDVQELGVDFLSLAGHKLYASKGVGALYCRKGVKFEPLIHGAGHENGRRAGTENALQIVGLGKACDLASKKLQAGGAEHLKNMRDRLHEGLEESIADVRLNGHPENRLPNTLSLGFRNVRSTDLLMETGEQVAVSAGSACDADAIELSAALKAMKTPIDYGMGTIRFSTGQFTTAEEVDAIVKIFAKAVAKLRKNGDSSRRNSV